MKEKVVEITYLFHSFQQEFHLQKKHHPFVFMNCSFQALSSRDDNNIMHFDYTCDGLDLKGSI